MLSGINTKCGVPCHIFIGIIWVIYIIFYIYIYSTYFINYLLKSIKINPSVIVYRDIKSSRYRLFC